MNIIIDIIIIIGYLVSLYFSIFLLLVYWDKKNVPEQATPLPRTPLISILVPAVNEENTILQTLASIQQLDYPMEKLDVIVINDGSTDATQERVEKYICDKPHFRLISQENRGKAASLNRALMLARGEFFACLDADSFVNHSTLAKMLALYYRQNDSRLAIITPAMKVYQPRNWLQKIQWIEYIIIIFISRLTSHLDSLYVAPGPFSLYRTDIIRKLGGFDEKNITEDQEIAYRVQQHNYKIKQCCDGYVYTTAPAHLKPFYRQRRRWYLGSMLCLHKYKGMIANRRYGDFGLMQMIKNIVAYALAFTGIILIAYLFFIPLMTKIKNLFIIKFNLLPYIYNWHVHFTYLDFLLADFRKGFLVLFLSFIGIFFFYQAHKNAHEKMLKVGWLVLIPYVAFYYLLKGIILLVSLVEFSRRKKIKW